MYNIINGFENIDYEIFFELRRYTGLRGHELCLEVERSKLNARKNFFSNREIVLWNNLPEYVVLSTNVKSFKRNYDNVYENNTRF